ncbi:CD97 antigen isoform X2 [Myripristis murdjan]|uniref:CD97 antigen isoform X2 n=1 Tax=Myripristis murdjan TaxID=586833 RepID=UPI0011761AF6|nr:CD97 antigen-like isoform X2 [Myripristis murdjan]
MRRYCDGLMTQIKTNRSRMWAFTVFLYLLGLNSCKASRQEVSMQVYYVVLTVEKSVILNVTKILDNFNAMRTTDSANATVNKLKMTTECEISSENANCSCAPENRWIPDVCPSNTCTFPKESVSLCYPNTRVTVTGDVSLKGKSYHRCLREQTSPEFQQCHDELLTVMKKLYSTWNEFDRLIIKNFSLSETVVGHFEVNVNGIVAPKDIILKLQELTVLLNATFFVETKGLILMSVPRGPVPYNSRVSISCTPQVELNLVPQWDLTRKNGVFVITNGSESRLTSEGASINITLSSVTEYWAGVVSCSYYDRRDFGTVLHKASGMLDIADLPQINILSEPQFPRCTDGTDQLKKVKVICEIKRSDENYTVTWQGEGTKSKLKLQSGSIYSAETAVGCDPTEQPPPSLACIFTNRVNQTRKETLNITVIYVGDRFCKAEGGWGDTKAGHTAKLKCRDGAGYRYRTCSQEEKWQNEESECVNQDLYDILEDTRDILASSSNILDKSLEKSWQSLTAKDTNFSLAERYLTSVEKLIEIANITGGIRNTPNVEVNTCNGTLVSGCENNVFNVTVSVDTADPGSVKTAGFKNLVQYLPNKDPLYEPGSIVVSTTIEIKKEHPTVKINFPLPRARPQHHRMKCVTWDEARSDWSSTLSQCTWGGAGDEGSCTCKHLSAFTILISKSKLEVKFSKEITYIGLSVSIASLILCLIIEIIVWSSVVKTDASYIRHTVHVHITLCLLIADISFLASSFPKKLSESWCQVFVVLKHFFYLSMFFWTMCLSIMVIHQMLFVFHNMGKKMYLGMSYLLGYVCPFLIVFITFITNAGGAEGSYYTHETCWLMYTGSLQGSMHTFIIPLGIIVFVNIFSMLVVIVRLFEQPKNTAGTASKEQGAVKTILRSVVLLTPIFGVTWIFGYSVLAVDLTSGFIAYAVNYAFIVLNASQGFLVLVTTYFGEKTIRDALLKFFTRKSQSSMSLNSTNSSTTLKKK